VIPVVTAISAGVVSALLPPTYESNITVLVKPAQPLAAGDPNVSSVSADEIAHTYATLMTNNQLYRQVISEMGLDISLQNFAKAVTVTAEPGTTLIDVAVQNTNPGLARDIATRLVEDFIAETSQLQAQQAEQYTSQLQTQIQTLQTSIGSEQAQIASLSSVSNPTPDQRDQLATLQQQLATNQQQYSDQVKNLADIEAQAARTTDSLVIAAAADDPEKPVSPNLLLNVLLGLGSGLLLALIVVFILEAADQSTSSDEELTAHTGLVILARIPNASRQPDRQGDLVTLFGDFQSEAYKTLRTNLVFSSLGREIRTILVTSPGPGEGKSRTAANLAVVLSQAGHKTLLVDADFRRPTQHTIFGKAENVGLSNLILRDHPESELVNSVDGLPNLSITAAGPAPPNPSELLGSEQMKSLLDAFKSHFRYVVIDSPPATVVTDPLVLAVYADAVLVVVQHRKTTYAAINQALRSLERVGGHVTGAVVNRVPVPSASYRYYGYTPRKTSRRAGTKSQGGQELAAAKGDARTSGGN